MSTFTMRLDKVLETLYNNDPDEDVYQLARGAMVFQGVTYDELPILSDAGKALGLSQYPLFHEAYRPILNGKIVDEYYFREIGVETIDQFVWTLRRKMQQIMPYYNKLYESEAMKYDALMTMDIHSVSAGTIEGEEAVTGNTSSESQNKSGARAVSTETPQTMLSGNGDYATGGTDTNSESEVTASAEQSNNSNSNTTSSNDNRVTGFQGIASDLIIRWRNAQINIDTMILDQINDCFMLVLNNGDSYGRNAYYL